MKLRRHFIPLVLVIALGLARFAADAAAADPTPRTWTADNGNGTFTNPLFYDEFSDPDLIRVGSDYYLTGTTMHAMPGLPVLHSRDLVNWRFLSYASDRLDLGPEYRLEGGEVYGQGIWAPCFRYHDGTFYIFTNVNQQKTQIFQATDPAGPWTRREMRRSLHDLSVLFDDDGRIFVVWGYNEIRFAELEPDLSDIKPGTERILIPRGSGMGEGSHFYRINGRYYLFSANYDPMGYMVCARADQPEGPYELTVVSARETLGVSTGWRLEGMGRTPGFNLQPPRDNHAGAIPLHQGGIVDTPDGEWWGFSMMDHNSIGRLTCLSPVTWHEGWPYFGLSGNLTRSPRTWMKPSTGHDMPPSAPYQRSDDFAQPVLQPVWQWNHVPDDQRWSLVEKLGSLRLHSLPAKDFFQARNTLTQRAVGPESIATTRIDASGLQPGDVAGLALLNHPYAWLGVARTSAGLSLTLHDQLTQRVQTVPLPSAVVSLRVQCDFDNEKARFSYSVDGRVYQPIGDEVLMVFQLKTFQGARFALFNFNQTGVAGGYADFENFQVDEPRARAGRDVPIGKIITLTSLADQSRLVVWNGLLRPFPAGSAEAASAAARFRVHDRGQGRVALSAEDGSGFVTVTGIGATGDVRLTRTEQGPSTTFQWQGMLRGDVMLMSLATHRYLQALPNSGDLASADAPGTRPDRKDGSCFIWAAVEP
jgi:xylan 1,4-beta-xylosidase